MRDFIAAVELVGFLPITRDKPGLEVGPVEFTGVASAYLVSGVVSDKALNIPRLIVLQYPVV